MVFGLHPDAMRLYVKAKYSGRPISSSSPPGQCDLRRAPGAQAEIRKRTQHPPFVPFFLFFALPGREIRVIMNL